LSACGATRYNSSTTINLGPLYYDERGYIHWNTSEIPDTATITEINFTFYVPEGPDTDENST